MAGALQRVNGFLTRSAYRAYRHAPVFGRLHGAAAVIRRDGRILAVERSDGLGLGFPGGLSWPWESPDRTVRREVREETGLAVNRLEFRFAFDDPTGLPATTSVFEADVDSGVPRPSWEGNPEWVTVEELVRRIMPNQQPIVDYLRRARNAGGQTSKPAR
jgi:8-oxo-dGTP pyrophosphatase MutT (NUDIX family)